MGDMMQQLTAVIQQDSKFAYQVGPHIAVCCRVMSASSIRLLELALAFSKTDAAPLKAFLELNNTSLQLWLGEHLLYNVVAETRGNSLSSRRKIANAHLVF